MVKILFRQGDIWGLGVDVLLLSEGIVVGEIGRLGMIVSIGVGETDSVGDGN